MLLVLTFVVAVGLPLTQVDGLLKLLNAIFGQDVFPSPKYGFRKLSDSQKSKMVQVNTWCSTCNFLTETHGPNEELCRICFQVFPLSALLKKRSILS
uniref:Putative secreted protein n=1 Tax=Rhipicephalus microplus TaxID=6941 RepID=A0A6M2D9D6_RHIMP